MDFRVWLELNQSDIDHWSKYTINRVFNTEQEAREFIFHTLQRYDASSSGQVFGVQGPDKNREFANSMPIYTFRNKFKIGQKPKYVRKKLTWDEFTIKRPNWEYIIQTAQANSEQDFEVTKIQFFPLYKILPKADSMYQNNNEPARIQQLAADMKENKWIEAIIVDVNDNYILEGQHRARAAKLLKMTTVPGIGIVYS